MTSKKDTVVCRAIIDQFDNSRWVLKQILDILDEDRTYLVAAAGPFNEVGCFYVSISEDEFRINLPNTEDGLFKDAVLNLISKYGEKGQLDYAMDGDQWEEFCHSIEAVVPENNPGGFAIRTHWQMFDKSIEGKWSAKDEKRFLKRAKEAPMAGGRYANPEKLKSELLQEAKAEAKGSSGKKHKSENIER